mmetsp:Transcript_34796/g.63359  ORF Transcript_34796/g.63359 Transcript_34796/m.63359 type:complete len:234 (+) Transcript_34796:53-754(+)|eukprot:CAMPEP_0197654982 /NCGR_PEP_ID=MMETSP1338-20131121/39182_1 /TAXON_ID=43686 ORGANISM="Pelagodinium beii, Strain RCC1491" /NCGR_SAMPLE_ID=MMETSP1338 /ASSEMBLY_ACC=CAM_ASM_000754 /LENGTH=233 /DNA_ID=CAMNT_0043230539 /DNA_START=51 /DNA_END=752 /DNA_ORIENTATION=-
MSISSVVGQPRGAQAGQVTDRRVAARQRQVDIGKARPEYVRYLQFVPKEQRTPTCPRTPDPLACVSKRQFDRQLSEWRRQLHEYDDPDAPPAEGIVDSGSSSASSTEGRYEGIAPEPNGPFTLPRLLAPPEVIDQDPWRLSYDSEGLYLPPPGLEEKPNSGALHVNVSGYPTAHNPWDAEKLGPDVPPGLHSPWPEKVLLNSPGVRHSLPTACERAELKTREQQNSPEGCRMT